MRYVFVSRHPPAHEDPHVYLTYEDGPIAFVIEVASDKTRANEPKKRDETYGAILQIPEYLYVDRDRDVLALWRCVGGVYEEVMLDDQGRLWSQELGIGFAWQEDGRLVRALRADGSVVPTDQEARALQQAAEVQIGQQAQRAEREARQRAEAEERAASLAAEVERLRRALEVRGDRS